jgi:thiamine-phosphate pyrophosphorylase
MDQRLITWARGVKQPGGPPPLWLFSDAVRMPDLCAVLRQLPPGLCGLVFRHDAAPDRAVLGARVAALCRARRIALVVAGDARLAASLRAGLHLRGGRRPDAAPLPRRGLITSSVHNRTQLQRARRNKAAILFCSPVFPTNSHPGGRVLGVPGFRALARLAAPAKPYALGGIDGSTVRLLGTACAGAGAIDAFLCKPDLAA